VARFIQSIIASLYEIGESGDDGAMLRNERQREREKPGRKPENPLVLHICRSINAFG
jgi:hypothetical protein